MPPESRGRRVLTQQAVTAPPVLPATAPAGGYNGRGLLISRSPTSDNHRKNIDEAMFLYRPKIRGGLWTSTGHSTTGVPAVGWRT